MQRDWTTWRFEITERKIQTTGHRAPSGPASYWRSIVGEPLPAESVFCNSSPRLVLLAPGFKKPLATIFYSNSALCGSDMFSPQIAKHTHPSELPAVLLIPSRRQGVRSQPHTSPHTQPRPRSRPRPQVLTKVGGSAPSILRPPYRTQQLPKRYTPATLLRPPRVRRVINPSRFCVRHQGLVFYPLSSWCAFVPAKQIPSVFLHRPPSDSQARHFHGLIIPRSGSSC